MNALTLTRWTRNCSSCFWCQDYCFSYISRHRLALPMKALMILSEAQHISGSPYYGHWHVFKRCVRETVETSSVLSSCQAHTNERNNNVSPLRSGIRCAPRTRAGFYVFQDVCGGGKQDQLPSRTKPTNWRYQAAWRSRRTDQGWSWLDWYHPGRSKYGNKFINTQSFRRTDTKDIWDK